MVFALRLPAPFFGSEQPPTPCLSHASAEAGDFPASKEVDTKHCAAHMGYCIRELFPDYEEPSRPGRRTARRGASNTDSKPCPRSSLQAGAPFAGPVVLGHGGNALRAFSEARAKHPALVQS
jgi:hypothetical protein